MSSELVTSGDTRRARRDMEPVFPQTELWIGRSAIPIERADAVKDEDERPELIEILLQAAERDFERRERDGDPLVPVIWFERRLPWSLDGLGPAVRDGQRLKTLHDSLVIDGNLQRYTQDAAPVRWIEGRAGIRDAFLGLLRNTGDQGWQELLDAYRPVHAEVTHARSTPVADLPKGPADDVLRLLHDLPGHIAPLLPPKAAWKRSWRTSFPDLDRAYRNAQDAVQDACERAWAQAFREARILYAEHRDGHWMLHAPHEFETEAPFQCLSFEEIERQLDAEAAERDRLEWEDLRQRKAEGRLSEPEKIRWAMFGEAATFRAQLHSFGAPLRELPTEPETRSAFLLSRDLGLEQRQHPDQAPTRKRKGGRTPLPEDVPIIEDLAQRVLAGEFGNENRAITHLLRKERQSLQKHDPSTSDDSHRRRLRGKLIERVEELKIARGDNVIHPHISN